MKRPGAVTWSDVSNCRGELFGIAILTIMGFHFFEGLQGVVPAILSKVYFGAVGSVGVDLFLFLSGFGIYYSLEHNDSLGTFYKKRFERVVFPYLWMGLIIWILRDIVFEHVSIGRFFYDYSLLSFWTEGERMYWYITLICILYAVSPFLYNKKPAVLLAVNGVFLAACVSLYFVKADYFKEVEIALLRVPVYFCGMYCARLARRQKPVSKAVIWLIPLSVPVKILVGITDFPFSRFFNLFYALFLILIFAILGGGGKNGIISRVLSFLGNYTLELYIVHVGLRNLLGYLDLNVNKLLSMTVCMLISFPIAFAFAWLNKKMLGVLNRKPQKSVA